MAAVHPNRPLTPLGPLTGNEAIFMKRRMKTAATKSALAACFHPLHVTKTLIQLGHEPFPLSYGKLYWVAGPVGYCLPNGIKYTRYMGQAMGYSELYKGAGVAFGCSITAAFGSTLAYIYADRKFPHLREQKRIPREDIQAHVNQVGRRCFRDSLARTAGCILASPLRVVLIRRIAAIIGGEKDYASLLSSLQFIHQNEGWGGFFKGLVPMLIAEWGTVFLVGFLHLGVERVFLAYGIPTEEEEEEPEDEYEEPDAHERLSNLSKEMDTAKGLLHMAKFAVPFAVNAITYPYSVISTVMTVNNVGLAAGFLPYAPPFDNWQQCRDFLRVSNALKRGSKLFFRQYLGPITFRGRHAYASN